MIGEIGVLSALLLGLAGSGHCLAMCGGIAGAFGIGAGSRHPVMVPLAASLGRVASYALLGGLIGAFGAGLAGWLQQPLGWWLLRALAALTVVLIGLQLAGWSRWLDRIAAIGQPLWRRLQPLARRLLPVNTPARALGFGALWGLLPCGLVWGMLTLSIGFAHPVQGALFMAAFGLGTLPALLGLGLASQRASGLAVAAQTRRMLGSALVAFGLLFFLAPWLLPHSGPLAVLRPLLDCG